ncbi:MAG: hypothetical protein RBS39_13745 [Phycisphaerales bacterium]|nr:hypothetical protein [Phycisphaerales bacterium]
MQKSLQQGASLGITQHEKPLSPLRKPHGASSKTLPMGATGLAQPPKSSEKTPNQGRGGNKSGNIVGGDGTAALAAASQLPTDPDLARVVEAWENLPAAVRAGIVAMVRASVPGR